MIITQSTSKYYNFRKIVFSTSKFIMSTTIETKKHYDKLNQSDNINNTPRRCSCCTAQYSWFMEWRFHIFRDFGYSLFEDILHITIFVLYSIFIGFNWIWYGWIFGLNVVIIITIVTIRCVEAKCDNHCYVISAFILFIPITFDHIQCVHDILFSLYFMGNI